MDYYYYHNGQYRKSSIEVIGKDPQYAMGEYEPFLYVPIYPNLMINMQMNSSHHSYNGLIKVDTAILVKNNLGLKKAYVKMHESYIIPPDQHMSIGIKEINNIISVMMKRIEKSASLISISNLDKQSKQTNL